MVMTASNMIPLNTKAPAFSLPDTASGNILSLDQLKSDKATVIMFICNHCPFVKHIKEGIAEVAHDYQSKGVRFIAISANDVSQYPEDSPEKMRDFALTNNFTFPYLYDESQEIAKAYAAACTPDFYIFDKELKCVYRGQFDDSRPQNGKPVTGQDIRDCLNAILEGKSINQEQKPSVGCNIKWKDEF